MLNCYPVYIYESYCTIKALIPQIDFSLTWYVEITQTLDEFSIHDFHNIYGSYFPWELDLVLALMIYGSYFPWDRINDRDCLQEKLHDDAVSRFLESVKDQYHSINHLRPNDQVNEVQARTWAV